MFWNCLIIFPFQNSENKNKVKSHLKYFSQPLVPPWVSLVSHHSKCHRVNVFCVFLCQKLFLFTSLSFSLKPWRFDDSGRIFQVPSFWISSPTTPITYSCFHKNMEAYLEKYSFRSENWIFKLASTFLLGVFHTLWCATEYNASKSNTIHATKHNSRNLTQLMQLNPTYGTKSNIQRHSFHYFHLSEPTLEFLLVKVSLWHLDLFAPIVHSLDWGLQ